MKRSSRRWSVLVLTVAMIGLCTGLVLAQSITAKVTGTVQDESGAVVPGVSVTVTGLETGFERTLISDDQGRYVVSNLSPGPYEIEAELAGFKTAVRSGVVLSVGQDAVINLTLEIGETAERVTVIGAAPLVETTTGSLTNLVDEKTLLDLPLNGRDYMQLATLTMGVSEARSMGSSSFGTITGGGTTLTVSGARPDYNQVLVDGTDAQDAYNYTPGGVSGASLGVDTLREFRIMKSNYSAEFGRAGGAVINTVTKSGTNEFHGSVFEYHRNSALDAKNFFVSAPKPPNFVRNQFGFTVGGPIIENKTFFFGSYEGLRDRLAEERIGDMPTQATRDGFLPILNGRLVALDRGGVLTFVGVDPLIQPYMEVFPLPTPGAADNLDGTAELRISRSQPTDEDYFLAKIDHTFSDSHSFFGRYSIDDSNRTLLATVPPFTRENVVRRQLVTLEDKLVFSPTLLNVFRVGFNRAFTGQQNNDPGLDPSLSFVPGRFFGDIRITGVSTMGTARVSDLVRAWNHYEVTDSVDLVKGNHSLTFGANFKRILVNGIQGFAQNGEFQFRGLLDFLQNNPRNLDVALPSSNLQRGFRMWLLSGFVQDDFQFLPNLTLNLGLRYDFISVPKEVNGLISNLREARLDGGTPTTRIAADANFTIGDPFYKNPSKANFAPRLGIAWDPFGTGRTSVRVGGGIFYAPILPANFQIAGFAAPPFTLRLNIRNPAFPRGWLEADTSELLKNLFVQPLDFEPGQPTMYQWNLTIQQEFLGNTVMTLGYAGSHGSHLSRIKNVNMNEFQICPCPDDAATPGFDESGLASGSKYFPVGTSRPNKNFAGMGFIPFDTNSIYHSLQWEVRKRFSQGLQFQSAYTYSRTMDASAGDHGGSSGGITASMDPFDWRRDWSVSSFDVTHNYSLNAVYDLPSPDIAGFGGKLLGGWQVGSIVRIASGIPLYIRMGGTFDPARAGTWWVGDGQPQRPDLAPGAVDNQVLPGGVQCGARDCRYLNADAYRLPVAGTFGNLGRYSVEGPGLVAIDLSVVKNTSISEQTNLQFRAEFFNLPNRANFSNPRRDIFRNSSGTPDSRFGQIRSTTTTERQIQLALRLTF